MKKLLFLICAMSALAVLAGPATVREVVAELPTYPYSDPDPVPCTGSRRYPYHRFDGSSHKAEKRKWRTVVLENDSIKVTIFPEIGGKVWSAYDKKTGEAFLYDNKVVKFRDISLRGPWTSGGIEFNFGVIGHGATVSSPVDWQPRSNPDGSASCFVGSVDRITGAAWQVEVRVPSEADYFETRTLWQNVSGYPQVHYHWMNAAYSLRGNPRFDFPASHWIGHEGKATTWPRDEKGRDLSVYLNNAFGGPKSHHVVNGDPGFYAIVWPEKGIASYHLTEPGAKFGRKIWLWALSREGGIWEDMLTDADGQYTELQSGLFFNQPALSSGDTPFKHTSFMPGTANSFVERWGVLRGRQAENPHASMERGLLCGKVQERPMALPADFNPDSAYGRYVRGLQTMRAGIDRGAENGAKLLESALEKEPCFAPALDELALYHASIGNWQRARAYARKAIALDAYDAAANYADGMVAIDADGDSATAIERLGVAAIDPRWRSSAMGQAAIAALRAREYAQARRFAERALEANPQNRDAILAKVMALVGERRRAEDEGRKAEVSRLAAEVRAVADAALERQPFFHALKLALGEKPELRGELPELDVLEAATWLDRAACRKEAKTCLELCPKHILARLRLAEMGAGSKSVFSSGASSLADAAKCTIRFVFPYEVRDREVLERAVKRDKCWKFKYLLAALEAHLDREWRAKELLEQCGDEPDDAVFYLYRARLRTSEKRLADLRRAAALEDSWRVGYAICSHFIEEKRWGECERTAADYLKRCKANIPLSTALGRALNAQRRFAETVAMLSKLQVLPAESGGEATPLWIEANRELAAEALKRGDEKGAKTLVEKALSYPENLGRGRPYEFDEVIKDWPEELRKLVR